MDKAVRNFLDTLDLQYKNVTIALSGGADSIATAHALNALRDRYGYTLTALHVNHHLRGEASDRDEALVRAFCESNSIPCVVKHVNITPRPHESVEQAARNARYAAFAEATAEAAPMAEAAPGTEHGANYIATAHNADDNAETILLNLLRGTGLRGLCGIPRIRPLDGRGGSNRNDSNGVMLIRPILSVTKAEVITYCNTRQLTYTTDETNADRAYTRNKLRQDVFPLLREINPSFAETASRTSAILTRYEKYFECLTEQARERCGNNAARMGELDPLILERLVSGIIYDAGVSPQERHIREITDKIILGVEFKLNIANSVFFISKKGEICVKYIKQQYRN